ncbi:hypothetical protein [Clostridium peptidivorans]|uniref:hypothetical protein n=1 Tax=Clostridium peptidivorans TaxID=100174 RepID=UPI000BE3CFCE|nr:hypothetical protein [Clostridium peptidivorans]
MSDDNVLNTKDNNTAQGISEDGNSKEKSREERINTIIDELNVLISDMRNSRQISDVIVQSQSLNLTPGTTPSQVIPGGEAPTQAEQVLEGQPPTQSQAPPTGQGETQSQASTTNVTVNAALTQTAQTLVALNSIKTELCRLPLDFCEREYIANCVTPLQTAMELISRTGFELATSVSVLTTSPIVPRKKGKLKDTIHTIYSMNDEVEDLYKVLKPRLRRLTQEDNRCIFP